MKKERIEFLTDAVYAIVMTLLVIEIKVPEIHSLSGVTNLELWDEIGKLAPLFLAYLVSFAVLTMYWMSNHALFHYFVQKVDRATMYLNMLSLLLIALIPFSAHFLGAYPDKLPAVIFYGANLILLGLVSLWVFFHVTSREHLVHPDLSKRTMRQAKIRQLLTPTFAVLGLIIAPFSISATLICFAFPIVFNLIPGTLNFLEKVFRFEI
jgi:uncharacterized membrane protein